jgi:hypothetical protein
MKTVKTSDRNSSHWPKQKWIEPEKTGVQRPEYSQGNNAENAQCTTAVKNVQI